MKEKLIQAIAEWLQRTETVFVFFGYDANTDIFAGCVKYRADDSILNFLRKCDALPKRIRAFEQYIEPGRVEYVIE